MRSDPASSRTHVTRGVLAAVCLILALAGDGTAQEARSHGGAAGSLLSESARVSLVTILPGKKVYSLFGHNALRVYDPERGIDIAYNFGTFDFGNPLTFSAKFAYGDLNYRLTRQSFERMVAFYPVEEGRPIIEQVLDLEPEQREAIFRFLEWNAQPENAYYRYDFYYDNCATRIRDVLEENLGEALQVGTANPEVTMRQLLDPYLAERSWLHFGMDAGQGLPADASATSRTELFLPDRLASWAAAARVREPGGERPLVAHTDTIGWTPASATPLRRAPNWPLFLMTAVLGLVAWITLVDLRSKRSGRAWLDVPFFAMLGLAGLLIVFLWFIALHAVTKRNLNLLWALPTNLALAWATVRCSGQRWVEGLLWGTAIAALLFALGWPLWSQEVPLATLPLALAVALRTAGLALARRRAEAAV
ncbi:MAG: DUF4105 domain-containing protein [marine benthic group bacterium]|nr:DUF4105 domain-containing protein [Gemmatimonadota bacterium]